jgi:hypothetical protein
MDEKKILIVNLQRVNGENCALLGSLITAKIQMKHEPG